MMVRSEDAVGANEVVECLGKSAAWAAITFCSIFFSCVQHRFCTRIFDCQLTVMFSRVLRGAVYLVVPKQQLLDSHRLQSDAVSPPLEAGRLILRSDAINRTSGNRNAAPLESKVAIDGNRE